MKIPISIRLLKVLLTVIRPILWFFKKNGARIETGPVILCYHSIDDSNCTYSVSKRDFRKQMEYIAGNKKIFNIKKLGEINLRNLRNSIAITFDDGYKSVFKNAYPVLQKLRIQPCIFVVGKGDKVDKENIGNIKNIMTNKEIGKLIRSNWEVGFHTENHLSLAKLSDRQLYGEIVQGKKRLEKKLKIELRYIAYPKGEFNKKVITKAKEAGFKLGFTVSGKPISIEQFPYEISRVTLNRYLNLRDFKTLLSPLGLRVYSMFASLLRIKDVVYG